MEQSTQEKHTRLRLIAEGMLPDTLLMLAFMEHQIDLSTQVQLDIIEEFQKEGLLDGLSDEKKQRLETLRSVMEHSSIDFKNMKDPLQAYKVPKTIEHKKDMRNVQNQYLRAQAKLGILGKV